MLGMYMFEIKLILPKMPKMVACYNEKLLLKMN